MTNCINNIIDFVLVVQLQVFPMDCICESFIVKLTFVEVHDKKESKLFLLAFCTN